MLDELAPMLSDAGMRKVHFSALSLVVGPMEIWQRGKVSPYIGAPGHLEASRSPRRSVS
jgi:hypothetical protein